LLGEKKFQFVGGVTEERRRVAVAGDDLAYRTETVD